MMALGEFFEEQFRFAEVFNRLHLNDGEVGLLAAIMIMNPGMSLFNLFLIFLYVICPRESIESVTSTTTRLLNAS